MLSLPALLLGIRNIKSVILLLGILHFINIDAFAVWKNDEVLPQGPNEEVRSLINQYGPAKDDDAIKNGLAKVLYILSNGSDDYSNDRRKRGRFDSLIAKLSEMSNRRSSSSSNKMPLRFGPGKR